MKKFIYISILLTCLAYSGYSQNIRLNVYGNYVFDDKVDSYYSATRYFNGTINGGFLWGAGLEFRLREHYGLELMYMRLDTKAPINYYDYNSNNVKFSNLDLAINYIMAGGARSLHVSDHAEAYGGLMLGVAIMDAKNPTTQQSSSLTSFAWGFRMGVNIWANDIVGIKLQAQLLSATQAAGGTVYFGTGGGGAGVSTYSSMLQFALGGGLTFNFGGHGKVKY